MKKYSRICAEIDLGAVEHNLQKMKELSGGTPICAVIKADAYGHGALQIARHIQRLPYLWGFAVATCEEAMQLRGGGIMKPILLLGYAFPESYDDMIDYDIRACVFDMESARKLSDKAVMLERRALIHIAVDTGMGRIGFRSEDRDAVDVIAEIAKLPNIEIEGMFTHFARADETSIAPAEVQLIRFLHFASEVRAAGVKIPLCHAANSASILRFPESHLDLVRAGITLYGLAPSNETAALAGRYMKPVLSLRSHISHVKTVPADTPVSYGGTFVTRKETVIATVPAGYADGYPRTLSGKGYVLIHGMRVPILGRICMDQFMVDVSELTDVKVGDEVVLIGRQEDQKITCEELGNLSGRFNYELACDISKRVPRSFRVNDYVVEQVDYFN